MSRFTDIFSGGAAGLQKYLRIRLKFEAEIKKECGPMKSRIHNHYSWKAFEHDCKIKPYKWGYGYEGSTHMRKGLWA